MTPRPVLAAMLVLLIAALSSSAGAQEPEVRRITQTYATSNCIGDASTPVCAVETHLACLTRVDPNLCPGDRSIFPERDEDTELEYQLLGTFVYWRDEVPPDGQVHDDYRPHVVNVEVDVHQRRSFKRWWWPDEGFWGYTYRLVLRDGTWEIADVHGWEFDKFPRWEITMCEDAPDWQIELCKANL